MEKETYPLIIVFYIDREMMTQREIVEPFVSSVNQILAQKNSNAIAFFLPTDGEERIECINPSIVAEADMAKINAMVEDISKQFSVGQNLDSEVSDEEITPDEKPCDCGNCKCD